MIKRNRLLLILYTLALWLFLPVIASCQPAPDPTPAVTTTPTDTPTHEPTAAPTTPRPATNTPLPIPATLTAVPTTAPTSTPQPYPMGTREAFAPEGASAIEPRLGASATLLQGAIYCDGRTWQMWWTASMPPRRIGCEGQAVEPEHIPMLVWSPGNFEAERARQTAERWQVDTWLVFNECEHQGQCETPPEEAARWYHDVGAPFAYDLNRDAKLIVGGVNAGECGMAWLERFVTYYRNAYHEDVPRAGWQFHIYPEVWAGPGCTYDWGWNWNIIQDVDLFWNEWLRHAENIKRFVLRYGREGDLVYITEMGCLSPPPSVCPANSYTIAERALHYFDTDGRWIDRAAWFADGGPGKHWPWTNLWIGTEATGLTRQPLGDLWLTHEPLPAVPLQIYRRHFPIVGYGADVVPTPRPTAVPTGYP